MTARRNTEYRVRWRREHHVSVQSRIYQTRVGAARLVRRVLRSGPTFVGGRLLWISLEERRVEPWHRTPPDLGARDLLHADLFEIGLVEPKPAPTPKGRR